MTHHRKLNIWRYLILTNGFCCVSKTSCVIYSSAVKWKSVCLEYYYVATQTKRKQVTSFWFPSILGFNGEFHKMNFMNVLNTLYGKQFVCCALRSSVSCCFQDKYLSFVHGPRTCSEWMAIYVSINYINLYHLFLSKLT